MNFKSIVQRFEGRFRAHGPLSAFDAAIERDIRKVNFALLPLLGVTFIAALYKGHEARALSAVLLWMVASLAAGGTLGFLFGIPKTANSVVPPKDAQQTNSDKSGQPIAGQQEARPANARANTNLEEVSDWLTKIVVGLTLVNLTTIRNHVIEISANMAGTFHEKPTAADTSFATALLACSFTLGFLCGYLYTRMFLQGAFVRSDPSQMFLQVVHEELVADGLKADELGPALPSPEQMKSAERVRQAAPTDNPQAVLAPLREMAAEYERIRMSMKPGTARTRSMSEVSWRMFKIALAAAPYVAELTSSTSSGERLAAVMVFKAKFNPQYSEWLARRLVDDPPFIGYQAAGALLAGVRLLGGDDKLKLQEAVRTAKGQLEAKNLVDTNRDELIEQILSE